MANAKARIQENIAEKQLRIAEQFAREQEQYQREVAAREKEKADIEKVGVGCGDGGEWGDGCVLFGRHHQCHKTTCTSCAHVPLATPSTKLPPFQRLPCRPLCPPPCPHHRMHHPSYSTPRR